MSIIASQPPGFDIAPPIPMKRFSVEEYHQMIHAGVFASDNRFELLEGWIVPKMSRNPPHDVSVHLAHREIHKRLPSEWDIRIQSAITTDDSEPEPDVAIVQGSARTYSTRHPQPKDIALVVEIADSSLMEDRRRKTRLYARAGSKEYWIVNLVTSQVEVYTDPTGPSGAPSYRNHTDYKAGESVPFNIGGQALAPIPVTDFLP